MKLNPLGAKLDGETANKPTEKLAAADDSKNTTKIIWPVGLARRSGPVGNLLTGQKTLTGQIGNGNEVAGVKVGKFRERVHNFASTDQMEATNSAK